MRPHYRTTLLASLLALVCAGVLWAAYDWFQGRYLRAFSSHTALFSGDPLNLPANLAGPGPIRVVHFWDPACPCNVGNQQHLAELLEHFVPQGVEFYAVQKPGSQGQLPSTLSRLKTLDTLPGSEQIPASPAVAIWDRSGKLAYFGPYSEGLTCNSSNSFIEPILQALSEDRPVSATHTLAVGCYCPWAKTDKTH
ncbi:MULTISPECIES: DUF6436 domain-containing protein [unclassified Pseudomonas]|uniref:DUF6436 domain-containing protein n=1 Tax=unclassified Pseudomonas TaxID=196821 RepID=UPI000CD0C84A|nr:MULTISPECIES: DUF6436 domain-containing protein [unclassified Pseudomonas]POA29438.1 thiol-disulfide isomerase [Pseudomonas sp. GW456-R21]POA61232.1 thiol-disulfide isomerase [Pseudomonas sp. GW460-R15]